MNQMPPYLSLELELGQFGLRYSMTALSPSSISLCKHLLRCICYSIISVKSSIPSSQDDLESARTTVVFSWLSNSHLFLLAQKDLTT